MFRQGLQGAALFGQRRLLIGDLQVLVCNRALQFGKTLLQRFPGQGGSLANILNFLKQGLLMVGQLLFKGVGQGRLLAGLVAQAVELGQQLLAQGFQLGLPLVLQLCQGFRSHGSRLLRQAFLDQTLDLLGTQLIGLQGR